MESGRRLSSEARKRTESFLAFVSGQLDLGSNDLGYREAVQTALVSLGFAIGKRLGLKKQPRLGNLVKAPTDLIA